MRTLFKTYFDISFANLAPLPHLNFSPPKKSLPTYSLFRPEGGVRKHKKHESTSFFILVNNLYHSRTNTHLPHL